MSSGGFQVRATRLDLLSVLGAGVAGGNWLIEGTAREPVAVLGSATAKRSGIDRVHPDLRIWLRDQWFNVAGILEPSPLAPTIDNGALIGYSAAERYLGYVCRVGAERTAGPPSAMYVRAAIDQVTAVQSWSSRFHRHVVIIASMRTRPPAALPGPPDAPPPDLNPSCRRS